MPKKSYPLQVPPVLTKGTMEWRKLYAFFYMFLYVTLHFSYHIGKLVVSSISHPKRLRRNIVMIIITTVIILIILTILIAITIIVIINPKH